MAARLPAGGCGTQSVCVPVFPHPMGLVPIPTPCSHPTRDPPPTGEDARDGTGKTGEYRPLRPIRRLLPVVSEVAPSTQDGMGWKRGVLLPSLHPPYPAQEESTKAPGRRKRKGKVRKKGLGQPSPAEEPERPGGGGDSRVGAAGGLLPPNRVGQGEPAPIGMATAHPGERGPRGAAGTTGTRTP